MNSSDTTNTPNAGSDGGFISFNTDNSSSNRRKTPFKSYPAHQNFHDQFSPHGSPQGFSSPYNQRNFNGNRRQSGNSYGDRYRGNQNHHRGNNWKNRNDNRRPFNNRSFNQSGSGAATTDISDYFHPSMIQDPWKQFQQSSSKINATIEENCENSKTKNESESDSGGSGSSSSE